MLFALLAVNTFTPLWFMWGIAFLFIEFTAIWARKKDKKLGGGTLSELFWRTWDSHPVWKVVLATGWVVLTTHFFFGVP